MSEKHNGRATERSMSRPRRQTARKPHGLHWFYSRQWSKKMRRAQRRQERNANPSG